MSHSFSYLSHLSKHRITQLLREYNTLGKKLFEKKGQGGRKYGYISLEEEKEFLFPYKEKAKLGKVTTVSEIQDAFEKKVGKKVARSTIYRLLHRHDWRKLVPRPYHPKRDEKKQEEFKKTSKQSKRNFKEEKMEKRNGSHRSTR